MNRCVCIWRGGVVRVFDVDDDGGGVAVWYIVTGVGDGDAIHRHDSVCVCMRVYW